MRSPDSPLEDEGLRNFLKPLSVSHRIDAALTEHYIVF